MDLRKWQKLHRWSNTKIANEIGVTPSSISRIALKISKPSLMLAKAIVRFTRGKVTFEDLGIKIKMGFLNQNVDENICDNCRYKNSPYLSDSNVYSPCIDCVKGNNFTKKLTKQRIEKTVSLRT